MNNLVGLALCGLFGFAGIFLYRNPTKVLDVFFKPTFDYGRSTLSFFRFFGAAMTVLAFLGVFMNITWSCSTTPQSAISWCNEVITIDP